MSQACIPVAVWSGEMTFGALTLRCHVLDDGSRIVEAADVHRFIAWLEGGQTPEDLETFGAEFGAWMHGGSR